MPENLSARERALVADSALVDGDLEQAATVLDELHAQLVAQGASIEAIKAAEKARDAATFETLEATEARMQALLDALQGSVTP